jgi:hypothetical protein
MEAYKALMAQNRIDDNTLYFVYANKEDTTGSLYMGAKLIISGENSPVFTTLDSLADVDVVNAKENSFLIKDKSGKWTAANPEMVATLIQEYLVLSDNNDLKVDNTSIEILDNII